MGITTLTIIGIIATLATFVGVYWKTTSARKEKEKHVHKDIVTTLARVLAQGQDSLDLPSVESLIKSKTREYDINLPLADEISKVVEDLVAKLTESEFITPKERHNLIEKSLLLRQSLERKEPQLEEVVTEHQELSRSYTYRYRRNILLSATAAAIGAVLAFVIPYRFYAPDITQDLSIYVAITAVTTSLAVAVFYRRSRYQRREKEARSSLYLYKVFEKMVLETLQRFTPEENIARNVRLKKDAHYLEVDFVIRVKKESIPIEIKIGRVRIEALDQLANAMKLLRSKRGILITSSQVHEKIKKTALNYDILILEGITTIEDLTRGLRDIKPFV